MARKSELEDFVAQLRKLPPVAMDFTTPEGAILCLEDAYRQRDLDAAIACKNFLIEGTLLLLETIPESAEDEATRKEAARVLELSYRKHLTESWPELDGVESFFVERKDFAEGIVIVTEICLYPNGELSEEHIRVAHTDEGWRVLNPVSMEEEEAEENES